MGRQEFIDRLRAALNGSLSSALVADHVNYYEDYIQAQILKGRSEEEVLSSLGDPRLIARTIIETNAVEENAGGENGGSRFRGYEQAESQRFDGTDGYDNYNDYGGESGQDDSSRRHNGVFLKLPGWLLGLIGMIIFAGIIFVVMSALSFLAPVLGIILLVVFLMKLFRDWLN